MREVPTYLQKLLFLFSLSILCGLILIPFLDSTIPFWLALITFPFWGIMYGVFQEVFGQIAESFTGVMGVLIYLTVFTVGGTIGAFVMEWLKSLLS